MLNFEGLDFVEPITRALRDAGYTQPTPIQRDAIPHLLAGKDVLGIAQTGTGKTAAFVLPMLQRFTAADKGQRAQGPRALILAPTRELAAQIGDSIRILSRHLRLRHTVIFGGVSMQHQIRALREGVDIVVATPGRLEDLLSQKKLRLDAVEVFVLDEADRMLDLGFVRPVQRIGALIPAGRQTVLFSATMPPALNKLASSLMRQPVKVEVAPTATTADRIDQRVLFVAKENKRALLSRLLDDNAMERVLIFTRTKHGADRVARHLDRGGVTCDAIHGDKPQKARERALGGFRSGRVRALVATDIAARGIDVTGVTHVINFEMPADPESYVHRIGRTARAGAAGIAISLCDADERGTLRTIEKMIRQSVPVDEAHPYHVANIGGHAKPKPDRNKRQSRSPRRFGPRAAA